MSTENHYTIPGTVELGNGEGGMPVFRIRNEFAHCEIYAYGAHVSSFRPAGQEDLLWMSPTSVYRAGVPLRGGVPVCFPWFGPHRTRTDLPLHGLVRTRFWSPKQAARLSDGRTLLVLGFSDDSQTRAVWPYAFRIELKVLVGRDLEIELSVENSGEDPFRYEDCLHAYLRVGSARGCGVIGLDGISYIDRLLGDRRAVQVGTVRLGTETVNAYMRSPPCCILDDTSLSRRIRVEQEGFTSTVVWNPGEKAAAKNPEIGAAWDEYVCIEPANCLDSPVLLPPGTSHRSRMRLIQETRPEAAVGT
ncbi:MAG TPA: D-hexose-6-phosphate mutarotase [Magnetospirillaceae bacterium]|nr:D-hexose-6-phosphate mutarotase [Magnetospirillaceae bacterium]